MTAHKVIVSAVVNEISSGSDNPITAVSNSNPFQNAELIKTPEDVFRMLASGQGVYNLMTRERQTLDFTVNGGLDTYIDHAKIISPATAYVEQVNGLPGTLFVSDGNVMNATLEHSHRMLRAWPGVEIIIVNSIVNGTAGHSQGWVYDGTSTIRYYNTLWCMDAANPGPNDPNCRTTPWVVEGEEIATTVAQARFIPLAENPLPGISPFFKTGIDQISAEYSRDGGSTWQALTLPNSGGPGSAPIGDPRYKIPLNLADANYLFRASYMKNSAKVGATSVVIDEAGTAQ